MKKIDLHLHTKRIYSSEWATREIKDIETCTGILDKAGIGVGCITNHNYFCLEQYRNIENSIKDNKYPILILPGIELDVYINGNPTNKKQLNLVINPEYENKLTEFLKKNIITPEKPIDLNKVIEEFGKKEMAIFFLDFKSTWKFDRNDVSELFENNENFKAVQVLDVNKIDKYRHLLKWEKNSSIGSDLKNWDEYIKKDSKDLIKYNFPIKSFLSLYKLFESGYSRTFFKEIQNEHIFESLDLSSDPKNKGTSKIKLSNISIIKSEVNIIFGPKSTGKTSLLRAMFNSLKTNDYKKQLHIAEDAVTESEILNQIGNKDSKCFTQYIDEFIEWINDTIKKYDENINHRSHFKNFLDYITSKNSEKIKIANVEIDKIIRNDEINCKYTKILTKMKESKDEIENLSKSIPNKEYKEQLNNISFLIVFFRNEQFEFNKKHYKYIFLNKTIEKISNIFSIHKNISPKVSSFGMEEIYLKRRGLYKTNWSFNKKINSSEEILYEYETIKVPIENSEINRDWKLYKQLCRHWIKGEKKSHKKDNNLSQFSDYICKIFKSKELDNIIDIIKKINDLNIDNNDLFFIKNKFKCDDEPNRKPSSGELAYIKISIFLGKKDCDYFFIDEPEMHLNNKFISDFILKNIKCLIMQNKTVVMTTLNSVLGLNTYPVNFILRESNLTKDMLHDTWVGDLVENKLLNLFDDKQIETKSKILEYFEGSKELYEERARIYK